jgi:hypothetical protein
MDVGSVSGNAASRACLARRRGEGEGAAAIDQRR